jgi:hypothetical protein
MSKLDELTRAAREASEVRGYQTDPDVVALRIERIRAWCDRLVWTGIVLGLLFTAANVQGFASGDTRPPWEKGGSLDWVIAWLLDPMVSLVLIGVLMGEQVINRYGLEADRWVRITKWVALGATYAMNTWGAWAAKDPKQILLHSVPPVIVVCAVEAVPELRRRITEAVMKAYRAAVQASEMVERTGTPDQPTSGNDAEEVDTSDWPDTPESLDRWLPTQDDTTEPAVPVDPDLHQVQAASVFAEQIRDGDVPSIRKIRDALKIGQPKAQRVQAYLAVLAEK